jgi:hypothetical protein
VILTLAVSSCGAVARGPFARQAADALKISEAEAQARITGMVDAQQLQGEGTALAVTDAARQLHSRIRAVISVITGRLWGDLPSEGLAMPLPAARCAAGVRPASQAALGRRAAMDRSDVVAALDELADRGLVERLRLRRPAPQHRYDHSGRRRPPPAARPGARGRPGRPARPAVTGRAPS